MTERAELLVIGGGIVGLAVLREFVRRRPGARAILVEKEPRLAAHQSSRNSGVIHSGIYYKPGSLKAKLSVQGRLELVRFCEAHAVPFELCGKLIVATSADEIPRLDELESRGRANLPEPLRRLDRAALREIEPHVEGVAALHVPSTGIVEYPKVCEVLADLARCAGADVRTSCPFERVLDPGPPMRLLAGGEEIVAERVVSCTGLFSDRVAKTLGLRPPARIVPFRGEYWELAPDAVHLVKGLVYPVPDPRFPFLGVHFTRLIRGSIEVGPNAVFAWKREGYTWRDASARDLAENVFDPAFWRLAIRHGSTAAAEMYRSIVPGACARAARRLVPELEPRHLRRAGAGVRAQALDGRGRLLDDFAFVRRGPVLALVNAPSPAATASLAIAGVVLDELLGARPAASVRAAEVW